MSFFARGSRLADTRGLRFSPRSSTSTLGFFWLLIALAPLPDRRRRRRNQRTFRPKKSAPSGNKVRPGPSARQLWVQFFSFSCHAS